MTERKRKEAGPATTPNGLPDVLHQLKMLAEESSLPELTDAMKETCPTLWEMLCPRWVPTGKNDGNGKMIRAWEEPLFSLSWAPAAGRYNWAITLRALNVRVTGQVDGLDGLERKVEACLANRQIMQKEIKHVDRER